MLRGPPDRRHFLKLLGGTTAALCTCPWSRASRTALSEFIRISIIHTTDLHGHILPTVSYDGQSNVGGLARCATQIAAWRRENPHSILIDVGDVYEGTQFGLGDQGRTMIQLFNLLQYDAWIIGNHEFDWGIEPFLQSLSRSCMPVLAANTLLGGKPAGCFDEPDHPFARIQPFLLAEMAGVRLAIIGLTTPGMPFWFPPSFTAGIEFLDPIEPTRRAIAEAKSLGANAIVLAGHMGLKERTGGEDFANRALSLTAEFPEATVFIAGHTHQPIESRLTNGVVLTQADHFGIHIGRVDLLFDRNSKRLLHLEAHTEILDSWIDTDPVLLSRIQPQLEEADSILSEPVGELAETLSARDRPGEPSQVTLLIAAAIVEALAGRGLTIDGVFHGLFDGHAFRKGQKTIGDVWQILPYENFVVTAELDALSLKVVMQETLDVQETRSLAGFRFEVEGDQRTRRLTNLRLADGRPLEIKRRYRVALNTFDASSGGHRFMKLREILRRPESRMTRHPIQVREALIAYFRAHRVVKRSLIEPARRPAA